MRVIAFSRRVVKEMLRDPLSYIFCLGFPIFMLLLFALINASLPPEARQAVFAPASITPGIGMFGLTFVMLFTSLLVSRDRESCLLQRLYVSPMKSAEFLLGYAVPMLILAVGQMIVCFAAGGVLGLLQGEPLPLIGCVRSILALLPGTVMFIALGLLLGCLLNDKAAPGVTSILITAASLLGGVWMPLEQMEGLRRICAYLPFYHCVEAARGAMNACTIVGREAVVLGYAVLACLLTVPVFRHSRKQ